MLHIACEMSSREKSIETENRLVVAKSWEQRVYVLLNVEWFFWRDKNIPELNNGNCWATLY